MLHMQTKHDGVYETTVIMRAPLLKWKEGSHGNIHSPLKPKEFPNRRAEQHIRTYPRKTANHWSNKTTKNYTAKGVAILNTGEEVQDSPAKTMYAPEQRGKKGHRSRIYNERVASHALVKSLPRELETHAHTHTQRKKQFSCTFTANDSFGCLKTGTVRG